MNLLKKALLNELRPAFRQYKFHAALLKAYHNPKR